MGGEVVYLSYQSGEQSSRVVPNAVAVRLLVSAHMFSDDLYLLFVTLAPQLRSGEVFR